MSTESMLYNGNHHLNDKLKSSSGKNGKLINSDKTNGIADMNGNSTNGSTSNSNLEEAFKAACDTIQNLPKNGSFQPSNEMLLKFYGYYKQATHGACKTSRPSMFKVVERAKWDSWNSVSHLSKEQAMQGYIDEIKNIIETMPHNDYVQKLIKIIGPFYEYVDDDNQPINNSPNDENNNNDDDDETDNDEEQNEIDENSISNVKEIESIIDSARLLDSQITKLEIRTNSFENIDKSMLNSYISTNGSSEALVNGNGPLLNGISKLNDTSHPKSAINGTSSRKVNGNANYGDQHDHYSNGNDIGSDEDEDFCDTSDFINEQDVIAQSIKYQSKLDAHSNFQIIKPKISNEKHSRINGDSNFSSDSTNGHTDLYIPNGELIRPDHLDTLINKYGGEMNSQTPASNSTGINSSSQNQIARQSRPGSSLNNFINSGRGAGGGAGGSGGGGGGFYNQNETFLTQDANRQILLILMRLQQDTNNVLTRLSYLESSVMTLQSNLQMNRIENCINHNSNGNSNQSNGSAFSLVNSSRNNNNNSLAHAKSSSFSFLSDMFFNIDWKTVAFTIIWPFIIRLIFYLLRKVKLVIKLRRIRN